MSVYMLRDSGAWERPIFPLRLTYSQRVPSAEGAALRRLQMGVVIASAASQSDAHALEAAGAKLRDRDKRRGRPFVQNPVLARFDRCNARHPLQRRSALHG